MATSFTRESGNGFAPPGIIKVSAPALKLARGFDETIKRTQRGDWVVAFDWAHSIGVRRGPDQPLEDIGACLTLGAFERHEIPPGFTQTIDGVEFAIKIPSDIWKKSIQRLIDADETLLFKLILR
jgi:hypothetical protein